VATAKTLDNVLAQGGVEKERLLKNLHLVIFLRDGEDLSRHYSKVGRMRKVDAEQLVANQSCSEDWM
jgi:hypothetical protein